MYLLKYTAFSLLIILCNPLFGQAFFADPNIKDPVISILNDSIVIMQYESIYDVHSDWDSLSGLSIRQTRGLYDYKRVIKDLGRALNPTKYHFIGLYSDDDFGYGQVPGWIHAGTRNEVSAKNIGRANDIYGTKFVPEWGDIMAIQHMNDIEFMADEASDRPNYGLTLSFFHEIGHQWGVRWYGLLEKNLEYFAFYETWEPWMTLVPLVNGGGHWAQGVSGIWVNPENAGIMPTAPENRFNAFDLYAMGVLSYEEVADTVYYLRDLNTEITYPFTVDTLISVLSLHTQFTYENEYFTGDGKRFPAKDPRMDNLRSLIVIITGEEESDLTADDKELALRSAREVPGDWDWATWGLSSMSTRIDNKIVNNIEIVSSDTFAIIPLQVFEDSYKHHGDHSIGSLKIDMMPENGSITLGGISVDLGDTITITQLQSQELTYLFDSNTWEDYFYWNAMPDTIDGKFAASAKVHVIKDDGATPTVIISTEEISPTSNPLIDIEIVFSEPVQNFTLESINATNADLVSLNTADDITFSLEISPLDSDGVSNIGISITENIVADLVGNGNEASNIISLIYDGLRPTVIISTGEIIPTNNILIDVEIAFSESVENFTMENISAINVDLVGLNTADEITFSLQISPLDSEGVSNIGISIAENIVTDLTGNGNEASNILSLTYDGLRPTVNIAQQNLNQNEPELLSVNITFSEKISGFNLNDFTVSGGSVGSLTTEDSIIFSAHVMPTEETEVSLFIPSDKVVDQASNGNEASNTLILNLITSIDDWVDEDFKLYPNPTNGILHFDSEFIGSRVSVFTLNGQLKKTERINDAGEINMRDLQNGTYILILTFNDTRYTGRVIKE